MEYLIKYETILGTYSVDPNFHCAHNGRVFDSTTKTLEQAKESIGKKYTEQLNQKIKEAEDKLKKLKKAPEDVENTNIIV